jgi:hypothetical protein
MLGLKVFFGDLWRELHAIAAGLPRTFATMPKPFDVRQEQRTASDKEMEQVLRPRRFEEFAGQKALSRTT